MFPLHIITAFIGLFLFTLGLLGVCGKIKLSSLVDYSDYCDLVEISLFILAAHLWMRFVLSDEFLVFQKHVMKIYGIYCEIGDPLLGVIFMFLPHIIIIAYSNIFDTANYYGFSNDNGDILRDRYWNNDSCLFKWI